MQVRWFVTVFSIAVAAIAASGQSKLPKGDGAPAATAAKPAATAPAAKAPGTPGTGASSSGRSSAPSSGQGYYRMKLAKLLDNQGWGPGIEAGRMLLPSDWRTEGEVQWVPNQFNCPSNMIQVHFKATAPDGITGIEIGPGYVWQWTSDPGGQKIMQQGAAAKTGCDPGPVLGAADYIRARVIPRMRPGARIIGVEPLPAVTAAKQAELTENNSMLIRQKYVRYVKADAASVRIAYAQNGQQVEELISTTTYVVAKPTPNSALLNQGQMVYSENYFSLSADNVFAARAPAGKLDRKLIATILASSRTDAQWSTAVGQVLLNMGNIQLKGVMDRQKIWHDAQQQISATIVANYQHQQAVQDRAAEQFSQTIRGVQSYVNPSTGTVVELTGGYNNAWVNNRGEYLLSDSPGFNPGVVFQEDWTELKKAK